MVSYFVDAIELGNNGVISPDAAQSFIDENKELISDLGSGFYIKNTLDASAYFSSNQNAMRLYSEEQITRFLNQIELGLQGELAK